MEQKINCKDSLSYGKNALFLIVLHLQSWMFYALMLYLFYTAEKSWDLDMLLFYMNSVQGECLSYYFVLLGIVALFMIVRMQILDWYDLKIKMEYKYIAMTDIVFGLCSIPCWLDARYYIWGIVLLGYAAIGMLVDRQHYARSEYGKILHYVFIFLFFTIVIISVVFEQKNIMRYETNRNIKEYCERNKDWAVLPDVWSVAMYCDGELVKSVGSFRYSPYYPVTKDWDNGVYRKHSEDCEHYMFVEDENMIVVTQLSWSDFFCFVVNTTFIFFVYLALSFIFYSLWRLIVNKWTIRRSFFVKVQTLMVFFLLCCLVLLFGLTVWFVNYKYIKTVKRNQSLRMESLSNYLHPVLTETASESIAPEIRRMSYIYNMDIIAYDSVGNLIVSTQADSLSVDKNIFEAKVNPFESMPSNVYSKMFYGNDKVLKIQSFCVLFDKDHHPVYIIMSSASEMKRVKTEISYFFVLILNMYFVLAIVCMLISYLIARQLVAPLLELEQKFKEISQTGEYVKIECSLGSDDELIQLVEQYNRMVDKLESSVAELAMTERDFSWRDMSRQIAHEIKNPLTPMRLLAQQIIAMNHEDVNEYKKQVRNSVSILLAEINTLIDTTEALSAFAKVPMVRPSKVNVVERIKQVVDLFKFNESACTVRLKSNTKEAFVYVDKDAVVQVFNNLLKNAIQSVPDGRSGLIVVAIAKRKDDVLIKVSDNGIGISDEIKSRIFDTNFSTKTQGMGLGLCVVKNVVEGVGGTVGFESKSGKGTTFSITLPLMN